MINYRNIFSFNYSLVILFIIVFFLLLLFAMDNRNSISYIGKSFIISGIISIIINIIISVCIYMISDKYRIFVQIITNSILKNVTYMSIVCITFGSVLLILSRKNNINI